MLLLEIKSLKLVSVGDPTTWRPQAGYMVGTEEIADSGQGLMGGTRSIEG